jgi:hypothetical protein
MGKKVLTSLMLSIAVFGCLAAGLMGLATGFTDLVNKNGTIQSSIGLIASAIAFASLLYYFKNDNS